MDRMTMQNTRRVFNLRNISRHAGVTHTNTRQHLTGVRDSIQPIPNLGPYKLYKNPPGGSLADLKRQIEGNGIKLNGLPYRHERSERPVEPVLGA
jgi:hypothetical protein